MPEVKSEIKFLRRPQSRWEEFKFTVNVLFEFVKGFRVFILWPMEAIRFIRTRASSVMVWSAGPSAHR